MGQAKLADITNGNAQKVTLSKDNKILILEAQRKVLMAYQESARLKEVAGTFERELVALVNKIAKEENINPEHYTFNSDTHEFIRK